MDEKGEVIGIIGLGPVGSILAAPLIQGGAQVAVVDLPDRIEQVKEEGLLVDFRHQTRCHPTYVYTKVRDLAAHRLKALFIATKTPVLASLVEDLKALIRPGLSVVCFQNGIGPEDFLAEHLPPQNLARGIVNYAGNFVESGLVRLNWFRPPNLLGPLTRKHQGDLEGLAALLTTSGMETKVVNRHEMKRQAFFKTIANSALNALCAISGITMAEAMRHKHTRYMAGTLLREGLAVAAAVGYHYGDDALYRLMRYLEEGGHHYPSMYQDLHRGRRTEIDFLNGKIARIGMMFKNLDVGLNIFFVSQIITEEIKNGSRSPEEIPDYFCVL